MPTASITSAKTGQTFKVNFANDPTEDDIDEVTSVWETEFYQREGLDPSIAEQGVLGTAGNAFARDLGGVALDTVGGVAKGAAETKRALGPAGEVLRLMPGMSTVMSLGGAGDAVAGFTDAVRERGRDVYPTNPANPVADTIGGGAGQAVAMLGTAGASVPALGTRAALTVVPSVLGGTMGLGSGIDTAKDMGIDNPAGRLALGAAFGGAEAVTERMWGIGGKAAAEMLQQGVKAGLKQAGKSVLGEAIEEPISGTLQDAATFTAGQFVADPNRPGYTTNGTKLPALDAEFLKRRKLEAIGGAAGGVVFGGLQMVGTQTGRGEEGKRGTGEPLPPPLPVSEDLGELTAEDVADLEEATAEDSSTVQARAPILTNVPDRVEPPNFQSGPGTTDAEPGSSASSVPAPVADVIETAPSPGTVADANVLPAAESPVEAVGTPVPVVGGPPTAEQSSGVPAVLETVPPLGTVEDASVPASAETSGQAGVQPAGVGVPPVGAPALRNSNESDLQTSTAKLVPDASSVVPSDTNLSGNSKSTVASKSANKTPKFQGVLWGKKESMGDVWLKLTDDVSDAEMKRRKAEGWRVERLSKGQHPDDYKGSGFKNLEPGGKSAGFVNGQILAEAEALIRQGFTDFANWSRAMVTRFGQAIRQYLQGIWQQVVAALPNDAAKNVRLGGAAKAGPVGLAQGGFVAGPEGQAMMVPKARTSVAQEASKPMAAAPPNLSGYEGEGTGNGWNREMNMSNNAVRALGLGRLMEADFKSWLADHLGVPESALTKSVLAAANQNAQNLYREYHHVGAKRDNVEFYNPDAVQLSPKFFLGVAKTVKGKANQERARRAALRSWQALRDSLSESGELGTWSFADEVVNTNGVLAQISTQLQTEVKAGRLPFQAAVQADLDAKTNDLVRKISQESDLIEGFKQAEAAFTDADKAAWLATNKNKMARSPWDKKAQQIKDATQRRQELQTKLDGIIADHPAMKMAAPVSRSGQVESNARLEGAAAPTKAEDVRVTNRATEATSSSAEISQQSSPEVNLQSKGFKNLEPGGKSAGFVNGQILAEAEALIREGFTDFANWSRAMVTRFGQAIRQYLQGIWEQVVATLPNDAAKNVRLGAKAKGGPVKLSKGGFVMGPGKVEETRSRFARPEEQERLYQVREDVTVKAAAEAWVDSLPMAEAVAAMEAGRLPADMTGDVAQHAAGLLIQRTTEMMKSGSEVVQMQARSLGHRISKVWQGWLSQEAGRNLRQRSVVNSELTPYAPILAAEGMLIDRADAVMDKRYEGGAEGAATKVNETADKAGGEASTELAQDLEAETPVPGESSVARGMREARKARALKKHPSLKRMLDALRKKLYPGMKWADIFMDLPSAQKERQREIYRRLRLDERLKGLSKDERLALTNELDKAWQRERRKVFLRELERVGIGEKAAADKAKVVKALPKLIRLINLGMMNSEMFREAIAPEYGLKQITTGQALALRKLAEEAYALPEGVLRSRKLAALLDGIQKSTGTGLPEVLNQYWVAAVLSGMRTQFDTFMSVSNGFGNQLIQSGMLAIKNGNRAAAMVSMLEWWRGLKQAFPEAMQILSKGDYSYLKRFNDDLRKALEGESTFRPVPLGEALWRDGNAMEKYGFAPVMIWTGRLMAAADHLNNSATTAGAKVVARALHPELYKTVSASQSEREAAAAQARREVTGGAMPATAPERATVAARTREILNGQLRPEEVKEAAFMGDQAAYQNDPTGVFGGIYRAVNQGLGTLERGLQAYADEKGTDGPAGQYARGLMLFFSGAMRSMMGAKFIRFGANFGNDMLGYVPGTVLVSPALLGTEATRSQRQLLMGKNVFGLMAGLTVAAMFLGKDDEEEGWHMEGPWSDLTPEEVKQRRAAGFESLTFWKRTADKVERVSYKQWPTAGLLAGVAHMQDRQRFRPEKWAKEGMAGHLLAAATVGAFQVKDVSAMRGLADLLGASKFGANPEDALVEKMAKMPVNFAGGFIPTLVKDLDALADSRRYKPETVMEEFLRNVPLARRAVAGGRPEINILGVAIEQDRKPWSRAYTDAESGPAHAVLGSLSARGFTLPTPETNRKVWKDGAWSTIAAMGADAEWRYQKKVGEGYRAWLGSSEGRALLTMPDGLAVQKLINRQADTIKRQALQAVMK